MGLGVNRCVVQSHGIIDIQNTASAVPGLLQPYPDLDTAVLTLQPGRFQLLHRLQVDMDKTVLLSPPHLPQGHRVHTAAGHEEGGRQLRHLRLGAI